MLRNEADIEFEYVRLYDKRNRKIMVVSLTELCCHLPVNERKRIQKLLCVIFPLHSHPSILRKMIQESYNRINSPLQWMEKHSIEPAFQKLLLSFGFLHSSSISPSETEQLKGNPWCVWPDENEEHCFLISEGIGSLVLDKKLKQENYLLLSLFSGLSNRETKAWWLWLGLDMEISSEEERTRILYQHLACSSPSFMFDLPQSEKILDPLPLYLDEVFPDDLFLCPMAWFYRDILPFYKACHETEKKLPYLSSQTQQTDLAKKILSLIKYGKILIQKEAPCKIPHESHYDKDKIPKTRWKIIPTKEQHYQLPHSKIPFIETTTHLQQSQGVLFS